MAHWGWYWRVKQKHIARVLCSTLPTIDSFKLAQHIKAMVGFSVQPLGVKAAVQDNILKVTYRKRKDCSYMIPIDKQPCNYGGFRYFFKCPLCQRRMRILYFAQQSIFLCRKCLNLSYETQHLRPTKRYEYMSKKIKDNIKDKQGNLELSKKPPRMHEEKYQKLKDKQFDYERKSHEALCQELRLWHGAKIEPFLDDFFDYR